MLVVAALGGRRVFLLRRAVPPSPALCPLALTPFTRKRFRPASGSLWRRGGVSLATIRGPVPLSVRCDKSPDFAFIAKRYPSPRRVTGCHLCHPGCRLMGRAGSGFAQVTHQRAHLLAAPLRRGREQPVGAGAGFGIGQGGERAAGNRALGQRVGEDRAPHPRQRRGERLSGRSGADAGVDAIGQRHPRPVDPRVAVLGRGDGDAQGGRELDALQLTRPVDQPDREIKVRLGEVGVFVGRKDVLDAGGAGLEHGEAGGEPLGVEFAGDGDGVAVGGLPGLHRRDAFLEPEEAFAQGVKACLALGREFEALGGAAEQDDAEHILQRTDLLADGGRGDGEFVSRAGERQVPRGGIEHAQGVEGQVGALHGNCD